MSFIRKIFLLTILFMSVGFSASAAKLPNDLEKAFIQNPVQRVIVSIKDNFEVTSSSKRNQLNKKEIRALREKEQKEYKAIKDEIFADLTQKGHSLKVIYQYEALPMMAMDVTKDQAEALLDNNLVTKISMDKVSKPAMYDVNDFINLTSFNKFANTKGGKNTAILILDTPLQYWDKNLFPDCFEKGMFKNHTDECPIKYYSKYNKNKVTDKTDLTDIVKDGKQLQDISNHGTLVAATVHAIAPEADIIFLNVFYYDEEKGELRSAQSSQAEALSWVLNVNNHELDNYNLLAVNMSLSGEREGNPSTPCDGSDLYSPITKLFDQNIFTFIAAGNNGNDNSIGEPGCISAAITVGAQFYKEQDKYSCKLNGNDPKATYYQYPTPGDVACFSNRNGMIDLVAPGVNIIYGEKEKISASGTSFASPIAAASYLLYQEDIFNNSKGTQWENVIWSELQLKTQAWPILSYNSYYNQLSLDNYWSPQWSWIYTVSGLVYHRGDIDNKITKYVPWEQDVIIPPVGDNNDLDIVDGVYLSLNIITDKVSDIDVYITPPSGSPEIKLPMPETSTANFNGLIGRAIHPGKFKSFVGMKAAGTWKIKFTTKSNTPAYVLSSHLIFVSSGCQPRCKDVDCGDDLCGGVCNGNIDCNDGIFCNGQESCRYGYCHKGSLDIPECEDNDGLACTSYCDEATKSCTNKEKKIVKGNCLINNECYADGDPDPKNDCMACLLKSGINDAFTVNEDATDCEDGDLCTIGDKCVQGVCTKGHYRDCSNDNPCTIDSCEPNRGCVHQDVETGTPCDDGNACTVNESCFEGRCTRGEAVICDDFNPCTTDSCNADTGNCSFTNNNFKCNDFDPNTVNDQCINGECVGKKKEGCSCNEANDPAAMAQSLFLLMALIFLKKRKTC